MVLPTWLLVAMEGFWLLCLVLGGQPHQSLPEPRFCRWDGEETAARGAAFCLSVLPVCDAAVCEPEEPLVAGTFPGAAGCPAPWF